MNIEKIYVIHYSKLEERKKMMDSYLSKLNIPVEYITDFDAEEINDSVLNEYHNEDISEYNRKIQVYNGHLGGSAPSFKGMNINEISCTIKHIEAYKKIIKDNVNVALVLEDDAFPYNNSFISDINESINEIDSNKWDVIFIGNGIGNGFINMVSKNKESNHLFKVGHPATNCAEAYILKRDACGRLLKSMIPFQQISDWELACAMSENDMNVYWRIPSLLYQGSKNGIFKSTLRVE